MSVTSIGPDRESPTARRERSCAAVVIALALLAAGVSAQAQTVTFDSASYTVSEGAGIVQFCLLRTGNLSGRTSGGLFTVAGTATDHPFTGGQDYIPMGGSAGLPPFNLFPGSSQACGSVTILDDNLVEGDESFEIGFEIFSGGTPGTPNLATVTILDNDQLPPGPPRVSFDVTGIQPNLRGEYVLQGVAGGDDQVLTSLFLGGEREALPCIAVATVLLDRPASSDLELRIGATGGGQPQREIEVTIPAGETSRRVELGEGSFGAGISFGSSFSFSIFTGTRHELGSPSRIRVQCLRTIHDCTENLPFCTRCAVCEGYVWLFDAGYRADCPVNCYPGSPLPCGVPPSVGAPVTVATRVQQLRTFRDDVMGASATGRFYTQAFYGFAPAFGAALIRSPSLLFDVTGAQDAWLEGIRALNDGRGSSVIITQAMVDDLTGIVAELENNSSGALRELIERDRARLDIDTLAGLDFDEFRTRIESSGGGFTCQPDAQTLCLNNGRFWVRADWADFEGDTGTGQARPLTGDTGAFWFFDDQNIELVIKVLDGRGLNGNFWVFYGALSDVEYTITVLDTQTGQVATYYNPSGDFASRGDTDAIAPSALGSGDGSVRELEPKALLRRVAADALRTSWNGLKRVGIDSGRPRLRQGSIYSARERCSIRRVCRRPQAAA